MIDLGAVAIFISVFSILIAAFSLGWNIYRDVILKPKVKVAFGVRTIHSPAMAPTDHVILTATNFGPGDVKLSMIQAKNTSLWKRITRKAQYAVIIHDYTNPMSAQLPTKVEVGDKIDLLLPYDEDCTLKSGFTHVGISDYYGRVHWAPRTEIRKAVERYRKDFAQNQSN